MPPRIIKLRPRFFFAVEDKKSGQSFVTWLNNAANTILSDKIHLDPYGLCGGGYEVMLKEAVRIHSHRSKVKGNYQERFLIVDQDRSEL